MKDFIKKHSAFILKIALVLAVILGLADFADKKFRSDAKTVQKTVLGEESIGEIEDKTMVSEDYRISYLTTNGDTGLDLNSEDQSLPLDIVDIKSEVYSVKDKNETRMVLSWKTNKTAFSQANYSKKGEPIAKVVQENNFGLDHSITLSGLDADSVYWYKIKSRDRWGNEKTSDEFVFYTGAPNISFMDVLTNAFGKIFGWAKI
ncbi:MAG TPA: fibronectin type III domain-containing protein [Candidatus Moranbacteria bacterium]|nr:fibronectin type III domain-containing protein [Candidatus Moranbacteria bacterium]